MLTTSCLFVGRQDGHMTPRPKEKRKYASSFKSEWMETCDFIEASPSGNKHQAFCTICRVDISIEHAGKSDVKKHLKTDKHKKNVESFITQGGQSSSAERDFIFNNKVEDLEVSTVVPVESDSTQQTAPQQITEISPSPTVSREIHVFGTAEISCPADRGSVRITLSDSKESADDVTNGISRRIDYILQTLRQHDVKDEDISVRRHLHRDDLYHMDAEDSYHMNAEVTANFSDKEKMEKVCNVLSEKLDKMVCVGQPQFYHSAECLSQLRTSACVTAVENAQQKASKVCHLLKQSLGPPLQLREEETKEWKSEEEEEERDRNLGGATPQTPIPFIPIVTVFSRVSATFSL